MATFSEGPVTQVGFVRWANGGVNFPMGTSVNSQLADRNDSGRSVGELETTTGSVPILLNRTTVTDVTVSALGQPQGVSGINKWGSIVGTYYADFPNGLTGFKRWSNGGFKSLSFPGAQATEPRSINDSGTIVGDYSPATGPIPSGFIYGGDQWATLNFPNSAGTELVGISNTGVIIGNAKVSSEWTAFLYENGAFKVIAPPGATAGETTVLGISPKLGLIVGTPDGFNTGFIAKCE